MYRKQANQKIASQKVACQIIGLMFLYVISVSVMAEVQMVREWVNIKYHSNGRVDTQIDYEFRGLIPNGKKLAFPETEWFRLEHFQAIFNDAELKVKREPAPDDHFYQLGKHEFTALHVFQIPSYGNRTEHTSINRYSYKAPEYGPSTKSLEHEPVGHYIEYILVTGAPWHRQIERIEVNVDTGLDCRRIVELEDSYKGSCQNGIWHFVTHNSEPDKNIRLVVTNN